MKSRSTEPLAELAHLTQQGRYREVLALASRHAQSAQTLFFKANAEYALENLILAENTATQALKLESSHTETLVLLASIANLRGDSVKALSYLRQLDIENTPIPECSLEMAQALLHERRYAEAIDLITKHRVRFNHPMHLARAAQIEADARDALGEYRLAFRLYQYKNQCLEDWMRRLNVPENLISHANLLLNALEKWPLPTSPVHADVPIVPNSPIFIVGFPRSGTTLLVSKLASLPNVDTLDERDLWIDSTERWLNTEASVIRLFNAPQAELDLARTHYFNRVREHLGRNPSSHFIDKFPLNALKLPLIAKVFPNASIIYCKREPRASIFSAYRRFIKPSALTFACSQLERGVELHRVISKTVEYCKDHLPLNILPLDYEQWMTNPDVILQGLCRQLALPKPQILSTEEWSALLNSRPHATPSSAQIKAGISDKFMQSHLAYAFELDRIF